MQRMAMASRVNIAIPSRLVSPVFFFETVFVGRHDARRAVCGSLADLIDDGENPATILSLLRRAWGTVSLLVSEHLFSLHRRVRAMVLRVRVVRDAEWFLVWSANIR